MYEDGCHSLDNFDGLTRLFPLPGLVFFPHAVQPLHIFEPRYRQMTADALEGDRLISLALLRPGWDQDYDGSPPVEPIACVGQITAHQVLPDGRYNLLLRGLRRVRLMGEFPTGKLYRTARAELVEDVPPPEGCPVAEWRDQLARCVLPRLGPEESARRQIDELIRSEIAIGTLCDILGFALPLPLDQKQTLLQTPDVRMRVQLLIDSLTPRARRTFPPEFSLN